ncbi:OmpA/MotB domain protein [Thermosinus carboxydivorans Nor1]|uniref:OmpA/MotB domain protein n=1 Tax=Thermosinus carboxydivorans Nor1 TaxID=401526 RepID=A1HM52_9FIRM|nr:flagellar motor protein MotB [Thermosinus carboxydivorans]EAX48902.1 OmpA/MotB domain protein [Thermosinus carboxydivorans Nor1]
MARKQHSHHEEHIDETWLVPYSDMLTLLLALFIVLYASAEVDQKKFEQLAQSFSYAFRGNTSIFESVRTVPYAAEGPPQMPILPKTPPVVSSMSGTNEHAYMMETVQLIELKKQLDRYIAESNLAGDIQTALTDDGLMIRIKDTALFASGRAELKPESLRLGTEIARMIAPLSQRVIVAGHTDNMPINTPEFPSNWDLSTKRALNFMKYMLSQAEIKPERISVSGYGEYRPVASNDTEEGRAKNRRVEVLIMRSYLPDGSKR